MHHGFGFGYGHFGAFGGFGWLRLIFGGIVGLALLAAAVLLLIWLIRALTHRGSGFRYAGPSAAPVQPAQPTALNIAQERYARGEITREEYKQMIEDLGGSSRQT